MSGLTYLASPYSDPNLLIRQRRFESMCKVVADFVKQGFIVYSPIVHFHPVALANLGLPTDHLFWQEHDQLMISLSRHLVVIKLPGWRTSVGVNAEIDYAKERGLTVYYYDPSIEPFTLSLT